MAPFFSFTRFFSILALCGVFLFACSKKNGTRAQPYNIAQNNSWERLNLYGKEKNVTAFSNDLLFEIAKTEGFKVKLVPYEQSPVIDALFDSTIDAVLTTLTPDEKSNRKFLFSDPYFTAGPVLVVKATAPISSFEEMTAKEVGFERGYNWALSLASKSDAIFCPYNNVQDAFIALDKAEIDGILLDSMVAYHIINTHYKNKMKIVGGLIDQIGIRIAVRKGKNEELITHFNEGLKKTKESGLYHKILLYWGLFDPTIVVSGMDYEQAVEQIATSSV